MASRMSVFDVLPRPPRLRPAPFSRSTVPVRRADPGRLPHAVLESLARSGVRSAGEQLARPVYGEGIPERDRTIDVFANLPMGLVHVDRPIGTTAGGSAATNPSFGEPGFVSARALPTGDQWARYLDALQAAGVTTVGRTTRARAPEVGFTETGYGDIPGFRTSLTTYAQRPPQQVALARELERQEALAQQQQDDEELERRARYFRSFGRVPRRGTI